MPVTFHELQLSDRTVHLGSGRVVGADGVVKLTTIEMSLLRYLADRPGDAVDRDELHERVWGHGPSVLSRALDTTVRRLRRKIEANPKDPRHLLTVHGTGYRLVIGDVLDVADQAVEVAGDVRADGSRPVPTRWVEGSGVLLAGVSALLEEGRAAEAYRVARASLRTLKWTGPYVHGAAIAELVLQRDAPADQRALVHVAAAALCTGVERERHVAAANALLVEVDDPAVRCRVYFANADQSEQALAQARRSGCLSLMAMVTGRIASSCSRTDPQRSQELFLDALELAQRADDMWEEAVIAGNLAGLLRTVGDLQGAVRRYRQAESRLAAFGDVWNAQLVCVGLGTLLHQLLRFEEAEVVMTRGVEMAKSIGDELVQAQLCTNLVGLYLDTMRRPDPIPLDDYLRVFRQANDGVYETVALANQGLCYLQRGYTGLASALLERAKAKAIYLEYDWFVAEYDGEIARVRWAEGHRVEALELIDGAIAALRSVPTRRAMTARFALVRASWSVQVGQVSPHADLLRELAAQLPVPSALRHPWEGLSEWGGRPADG